MELGDVTRRIFGQHSRLILLFVLAGICVAALFHGWGAQTYTASTRLVLDTQDPKSRGESTSIADTAKALATSPSQVRSALEDAHITGRDPLKIAGNDVSITALGTSAILQLSVSDRNPRVAAAVANALASRVIRVRLEVSNGQLQGILSDLDRKLSQLNTRIAAADPAARDFLAQQRSVLESERVSLLANDASRPKPSIISPAAVPSNADSSRWLPYLVLGALLGLVLGVGSAGLIETARPTLIGGDMLARELDTPLLGAWQPNNSTRESLSAIAARLRVAADSAGVKTVGLLAAVPNLDVHSLADQMQPVSPETLEMVPAGTEELRSGSVQAAVGTKTAAATRAGGMAVPFPAEEARPKSGAPSAPSAVRIRPFSIEDGPAKDFDAAGLVVVTPTNLKRAELADVDQVLRLTRLPLIGLITYTPPRQRVWGELSIPTWLRGRRVN